MTSKMTITLTMMGIALFTISTASADSIPLPLTPLPEASPTGLSVIYTPETGNVTVTAVAGTSLTTLQLDSLDSLFNGNCDGLDGGFDVCDPDKVFTINTDGFENVNFGEILARDIVWEDLQQDLLVNGSSLGGGFDVGDGPFLAHSGVPEPSSLLGLVSGLGLLIVSRRRRSRA